MAPQSAREFVLLAECMHSKCDTDRACNSLYMLHEKEGSQPALLQGLDAEALTQLMQSVNLHNEPIQSAASLAQAGIPIGSAPAQGTSSQDMPSECNATAGQDMLADCPLPFQDSGPAAGACTPARARRNSKREAANEGSDEEGRVRVCSGKYALVQ